MPGRGYATFDTPLGTCGVAFDDAALLAVALPAQTEQATVRSLVAMVAPIAGEPPLERADAPSGVGAQAIDLLSRYLAGEAVDLGALPVADAALSPFQREVYAEARRIPRGEVRTYAELAAAAGHPGSARAVGACMARNRWPVVVPCHRVVAAGGALHGFSAPGGIRTKAALLTLEGARDRTRPAVGGSLDLFDET